MHKWWKEVVNLQLDEKQMKKEFKIVKTGFLPSGVYVWAQAYVREH